MSQRSLVTAFQTYVLRMWRENLEDGGVHWRYSLLETETGRRLGFDTPMALGDFLSELTNHDGIGSS